MIIQYDNNIYTLIKDKIQKNGIFKPNHNIPVVVKQRIKIKNKDDGIIVKNNQSTKRLTAKRLFNTFALRINPSY